LAAAQHQKCGSLTNSDLKRVRQNINSLDLDFSISIYKLIRVSLKNK